MLKTVPPARQTPPSDDKANLTPSRAPLVTAVVAAILIVVALAGRSSYTPKILDQMFGISDYIEKEAFSKVDSGYSAVLLFDSNPKSQRSWDDASVLFYAEKGQPVLLTLDFEESVVPDGLRIILDGQEAPARKRRIFKADITNQLPWDLMAPDISSPGLHVLRIVPVAKRIAIPFAVKVLVLVQRSRQGPAEANSADTKK